MKTIKENKKNLIKEYNSFLKDFNLSRNIFNVSNFANTYIEYQIKTFGFFQNKKIKVKNIVLIKSEIEQVINQYECKKLCKRYDLLKGGILCKN